MNPQFRSHYFHDADARAAFKRFLVEIHGLDLSLWEKAGYWDPNYIPFSYFEDGEVIACTCVYSLPMTVQGEECYVAQLSSVGTRPAYRRRGLNRELTRHARDWVRQKGHRFTYLFADEEAEPFYQACGFHALPQHHFRSELGPLSSAPARSSLASLDLTRECDRRLLEKVTAARTPVSRFLGHRSFELQMFHGLYTLRDCLSYLPEFDLVVAARRVGDTLLIHDLIGRHLPSFAELQAHLPHPEVRRVEFGFVPDLLEVEYYAERDDGKDGTYVDDLFPLAADTPFRFPNTSQA